MKSKSGKEKWVSALANISDNIDTASFRVVTINKSKIVGTKEHPLSQLVFEANQLGLDGKKVMSVSRPYPDPSSPNIQFVMHVEDLVQL